MAKIASTTIDEINARTDIVALVGEYVHLDRRGTDWWGCCPFHNEKTPSFHVVPDRKMYHCFGCGQGGGLINFYMEMEKVSFGDAVEALAKKSGVEVVYEGGFAPNLPKDDTKDQLLELYRRVAGTWHYFLTESAMGKPALEYLQKRGLSQKTITDFMLGYAPADRYWLKKFLREKNYTDAFLKTSGLFSKNYPDVAFFSNRIMFPIFDRKGQVVAFGGRLLSGEGPKYLNSGDLPQYKKGETLYAFNLARQTIREQKTIILCEGYMDVIAFHQADIKNAVAPLGTALTEEQVRLIKSFADTVLLALDSDQAGQNATYKAILMCRKANLTVKIIQFFNGKDPADILLNFGAENLKTCVESAIIDSDYLFNLLSNRYHVDTPEGKTKASLEFFPYIDSIQSDIQKESLFEQLAQQFNLNLKAVKTDFLNRDNARNRVVSGERTSQNSETQKNIKLNAELRAVLAVVSNLQYFTLMRSTLTVEDFEDALAKDLFLVLEECYRDDAVSYDSLLMHCLDENVRTMVIETVTSGEFAENTQRVIEDSIKTIRRNSLERKRERLVNKIRQFQANTLEQQQQLSDLLLEKMNIDSELTTKDTNE